jgi:predicted DNA-binding protein
MEVHFTPEQEARLAEIARFEGVSASRLVHDAAVRLIENGDRPQQDVAGSDSIENARKVCPECGHRFKGNGYDGIDAHWRSKHEDVMPYERAWEMIKSGMYTVKRLEDLEDRTIAEERLLDLRAGRSRTHSLDEVERDLGLAG